MGNASYTGAPPSRLAPEAGIAAGHGNRGRFPALVAVAALALASNVAASECFAPPPSAAHGDRYAAIEPSVLSARKQRTVGELLARLAGRWRGTAQGYFCEGRTGAARERRDDHSVEVEVDVASDGSLELRAVLESTTGATTRNETLRLFLRDDRLRVERDNAAGDVRVLELAAGRIVFLHKASLAGSGNFTEVSRRIALSGRSLRIDYEVYSQGGLSAASKWVLTRR